MIDSHCHLTDPRLAIQLDDVLARARAAGVTRLITIGTGLEDAAAAIAVCENRPHLRCAIGIHPNHAAEYAVTDVQRLRGMMHAPAVLALGEMGLDYHYDFAPKTHQAAVFQAQLHLAAEINKPVVIHSRQATDDTLAILRDFPTVRAVFHCFTGTPDEADKILAAGYLLGFTGPVTYKKSDGLRAVAATIPGDRFLVETDAPYLSPEPVRKQKTNEPALVVHVADAIAKVRNTTREEIDRLTTANVARLFGW